MDILITGGAGQVGLELRRFPWPAAVRLHAPSRAELDLGDLSALARVVAARPWGCIINAGAYTAVDKAESEVAAAWTLNALGPAVLAAETAKAKIPLVHVSTDYVFSGAKTEAYVEDDPVGPLGVYGASKEGGEQAVRSANPRSVIVRTAWVVSEHRANFVKTVLRLAKERDRLRIVADQQGSPTSARDLAAALAAIALRLAADATAPTGTFHVVNTGTTTWHGLASEVVRLAFAGLEGAPVVDAISTAEYPTPARRPANSRLATAKAVDAFGVRLRPWPEAVAEIVATLKRQ